MPIYTYRCKSEHSFDKLVPISEADTRRPKCPECGSPGKRVLISAAFDRNTSKTKSNLPRAPRRRYTNW